MAFPVNTYYRMYIVCMYVYFLVFISIKLKKDNYTSKYFFFLFTKQRI